MTSLLTRGATRSVLAAVSLATLALAPTGARAAVLDANCTPEWAGNSGRIAGVYAQTFTAQNTGSIVRGERWVGKFSDQSGGDFLLQIYQTSSGLPTGPPLGTATIPDGTVPGRPYPDGVYSRLSGSFNPPVPVTAGNGYAIALARPGGGYWESPGVIRNSCPGNGVSYNGQEWSIYTPPDGATYFSYAIFVEPSIPTNPSNNFTVGKRKNGEFILNVPGPGEITVANAGTGGENALASAKNGGKLLKTTTTIATTAGQVVVKPSLTKRAKGLLARKDKLKANAAITYTPTGGAANSLTAKLKFKRR